MSFTMKGASGELTVSGRTAAALMNWQFTPKPDGWTVTGKIASRDDFWLTTRETFTLRLDVGQSVWRWREVKAVPSGAEITITGVGEPDSL